MAGRLIYNRTVAILVWVGILSCFDAVAQGRVQWVLTDIDVQLNVRDNNDAPVEGASVYLVEKGDSLITNFSITDKEGRAHLEHVTQGTYFLNIELLGFLSVSKECTLNKGKEDLGTFKIQVDQEMLAAAKITAVGNPIIVKQDTIVFIATAFNTKRNANLKDLISRFPGCEVSDDGIITVNGETVDRITVGGRTFFSGNNAAALNNLPAQLVERVSVIDKQADGANFTGIKGESEKVMDVTLKKEYRTGFFGNAAVEAGSTVRIKGEQDPMFEDQGLLYNANTLVAAYDSLTQVTVIGNLNNFKETGGRTMVVSSENKGLTSTRQAGVNLNTLALKGFETDVSVNLSSGATHDLKQTTQKSIFKAADDYVRLLQDKTGGKDNYMSISGTVRNKDRHKYLLSVSPHVSWSGNSLTLDRSSSSFGTNACIGETRASTVSSLSKLRGRINLETGIKDLFGREGRALTMNVFALAVNGRGKSQEQTDISGVYSKAEKALLYESTNSEARGKMTLTYIEPIAACWAVSASSGISSQFGKSIKDAFDCDTGKTPNEFYSSSAVTKYLDVDNKLLLQYSKKRTTVQFGAAVINTYNAASVKSLGKTSDTGGDWTLHATPFVNVRTPIGKTSNLEAKYSGVSSAPEAFKKQPSIDISNPADIRIGNIYLKPVFKHNTEVSFSGYAPSKYIQYSFRGQMSLEDNALVDASWIDGNGTRYYIPVNSLKTGKTISLYFNYGMPVTRDKRLRVYITPIISYAEAQSYQCTSDVVVPLENFVYADVMASIYGNEKGDRFYEGKSGFQESTTKTVSLNTILVASYEKDNFSFDATCQILSYRTSYTLDPSADFYRSILSPGTRLNYTLPKGFALWSEFNAALRHGYSELNNRPEYSWNAELTKDIGSFTIALRGIDLLNSTRNYIATNTADYIQETYGLTLGRTVLVGVKFNFGKMSAANGTKATTAMLKMTLDN